MEDQKNACEQVVKALECCRHNEEENTCKYCIECPAGGWEFEEELTCIQSVYVRAAALMNRQRAEIDRLSVEMEAMRGAANSYKMHYENAKTEVAKEIFAEIDCILNFYKQDVVKVDFLKSFAKLKKKYTEI